MNINTNFHTLWGTNTADAVRDATYEMYRHLWYENPSMSISRDFPLFLDIEASSVCNLRCPHCVHGQAGFYDRHDAGYMPWEMYVDIIDEAAAEGCYGCKYHSIARGEPLMSMLLERMVAYAKKKGLIDVYLNTNGVLLDHVRSAALLDAGLDRISFSVDGLNGTYEQMRPGARFEKVVYKIIQFLNWRATGNYNTKVRVQTVRLPGIDLDQYVQYWKGMLDETDEVAVVDYKDMGRRRYVEGKWRCPQPWQRLSVLWDGSILPCNHDDRQYAKLGMFPEMTLKKAWQGHGIGMIRDAHRRGAGALVAACNGCYLMQAEIEKEENYEE